MATGVDLSLSGLASGFDWKSFVDQMVQAERAPETRLRNQQSQILQRNTAFSNLKTQLGKLQAQVQALKEATLYNSRTATTSDSATATATAATGTVPGIFALNIAQLATPSKISGVLNVGSPLSSTSDVSAVTLASAGFPTAPTAGTFTVNGEQVTITTSDTLKQVFDKIAAATHDQVTASYDPSTDKITLSSDVTIVLGSATDSSNFLQVARLSNNGATSVTSNAALGGVRPGVALSSAGFSTPVTNGSLGSGEFEINGVSISFNASTDSFAAVAQRINDSSAGVTASYDGAKDQFVLTSKATGDMGIALHDVSGNFLAATGLAAGTLTRGKDLMYSLNGGDTLTSHSNTITEASSGITGLSVTALKENASVTVTVASDTTKLKSAIQSFVDAYNQVQSFISSQSGSSTDSKGVVTAGLLASDRVAGDTASSLRSILFSPLGGLSGTLSHLADLGYQTNGYNNQIALSKADQLDQALAEDLPALREFFTDESNGLAVKLDGVLTRILGDTGMLATHQNSLTRQSSDIDAQIAKMEKTIKADQTRMTKEFVAMETAQANINQQLQYLSQNFR